MVCDIVDGGYSEYGQHPHECEEYAQGNGEDEGVEGWMEIEVAPHLGCKELYGGVHGCGEGYGEDE